MKIATLLQKNANPAKRLVDFPLERDTFLNEIMELVEDFDETSYNNNGKPWTSSMILRVNEKFLHFFIFSCFSSFFSFFSFFHCFIVFHVLHFCFSCLLWAVLAHLRLLLRRLCVALIKRTECSCCHRSLRRRCNTCHNL